MAYQTVPLTTHAKRRSDDRSIPEVGRWLLMEFGSRRPAGKGTESLYFDKKSWKEVEKFLGVWPLKNMEQLKRLYMVLSPDGSAITVAYRD